MELFLDETDHHTIFYDSSQCRSPAMYGRRIDHPNGWENRSMQKLESKALWLTIQRLAEKCPYKLAAIAYVTDDRHIHFEDGDKLVCDASDGAISQGHTSVSVLSRFFRKGAEIFSCPGLHAKLLVLGNTAIVGSANLSQSSANDLIEAAVVTDQPSTLAQVGRFIEALIEGSQPVDKTFLRRIGAIPVTVRRPADRVTASG
jgi:hypothetical protein